MVCDSSGGAELARPAVADPLDPEALVAPEEQRVAIGADVFDVGRAGAGDLRPRLLAVAAHRVDVGEGAGALHRSRRGCRRCRRRSSAGPTRRRGRSWSAASGRRPRDAPSRGRRPCRHRSRRRCGRRRSPCRRPRTRLRGRRRRRRQRLGRAAVEADRVEVGRGAFFRARSKITYLPFGATLGAVSTSGPLVTRRRPEPSARTEKTSPLREKTIARLSGENDGSVSVGSSVSWLRWPSLTAKRPPSTVVFSWFCLWFLLCRLCL